MLKLLIILLLISSCLISCSNGYALDGTKISTEGTHNKITLRSGEVFLSDKYAINNATMTFYGYYLYENNAWKYYQLARIVPINNIAVLDENAIKVEE